MDPVCGMKVEADNAGEFVSYGNLVYYFCSTECREKFEFAPDKYASDGRISTDTAAIPDDQKTHEPS
jgi:YHS domain-containing protein